MSNQVIIPPSPKTTIYALMLADRCFYLDVSDDPVKAFQAHREGAAGCAWTEAHPVRFIDNVFPSANVVDLDMYVIRYMAQYGMDRVRGGSWQTVTFDAATRLDLRKRIEDSRGGKCVIQ